MTSLKPPLDVTRSRESRVLKNREHEQRLISQLTIKRNSVLLQLRAAQLAGKGGDNLEETRRSLECLARELDRHLAAAGQEELPIPAARGRRQKRPAPAPPPPMTSLSNAISAPDLARGAPSPVSDTSSRRRLKKSLSLSGSRSFFATMLATLRVGRSRVPALYRRSRSQESLNLAPLDMDQKLVSDTAVRAQQRRESKSHNRSHSAEPRQFLNNTQLRHGSSPQSPKRPDHLFLPTHKHRYTPRERSPLTMRPLTPHELYTKTPTPDQEPYFVQGVSEAALNEIVAFEKLIVQFMSRHKPPSAIPGPGY